MWHLQNAPNYHSSSSIASSYPFCSKEKKLCPSFHNLISVFFLICFYCTMETHSHIRYIVFHFLTPTSIQHILCYGYNSISQIHMLTFTVAFVTILPSSSDSSPTNLHNDYCIPSCDFQFHIFMNSFVFKLCTNYVCWPYCHGEGNNLLQVIARLGHIVYEINVVARNVSSDTIKTRVLLYGMEHACMKINKSEIEAFKLHCFNRKVIT